MKITFQTKEESNQKQREEFLKLSGAERVVAFFVLSRKISAFPTKKKEINPNNFIIDFTKQNKK